MEQRKYILSSRSNQISIEIKPIKTRRNFLKSFSTNHGLKLKKKEEEDEFEDAAACYNVGIKERNVRKKKGRDSLSGVSKITGTIESVSKHEALEEKGRQREREKKGSHYSSNAIAPESSLSETSSRRFLFAYPLLPPIVIIGPCALIIKQLII